MPVSALTRAEKSVRQDAAEGKPSQRPKRLAIERGVRCLGLERKIRSIIQGGSVRQKFCVAHEKTKRQWIGDKWGTLPGERSVGRKERELEKRGILERKEYGPGQDIPLGWTARRYNNYYGIVAVRLRRRQEQRAIKRAKKKEAERQPSPGPVFGPELPPITRPPISVDEPGGLYLTAEQRALNAQASADILAILAGKGPAPPKTP
jgi:hypothetical protein